MVTSIKNELMGELECFFFPIGRATSKLDFSSKTCQPRAVFVFLENMNVLSYFPI